MIGDWKLESSEGFNNFMYGLETVDWITRQISVLLYPLDTIRQAEDGLVSYTLTTWFRGNTVEFYINQPFEEYTLDYRTTTTMPTLEGNKLVKVQVPDPAKGQVTTRQVREFLDTDNDGLVETMLVHLTIENPKKPEATSRRVYKRV